MIPEDTRSARSRLIAVHIERLEKLSKVQGEARRSTGYIVMSKEELRRFFTEWPRGKRTDPAAPQPGASQTVEPLMHANERQTIRAYERPLALISGRAIGAS